MSGFPVDFAKVFPLYSIKYFHYFVKLSLNRWLDWGGLLCRLHWYWPMICDPQLFGHIAIQRWNLSFNWTSNFSATFDLSKKKQFSNGHILDIKIVQQLQTSQVPRLTCFLEVGWGTWLQTTSLFFFFFWNISWILPAQMKEDCWEDISYILYIEREDLCRAGWISWQRSLEGAKCAASKLALPDVPTGLLVGLESAQPGTLCCCPTHQ